MEVISALLNIVVVLLIVSTIFGAGFGPAVGALGRHFAM